MSDLNLLFRKRIGLQYDEVINFYHLNVILEKTAKSIPFENLCIMENKTQEITKENLISKLLVKNEGGLCYELNSMLYLFLHENGFKVRLARGVVYDNLAQKYPTFGRTHVTILLTHNEETYLIDTGFGANLPLKAVPFTGEIITSNNGEFRIEKEDTEFGDYVLLIKLKHKDLNWRIGYAFDSQDMISDVSEFNEIQTIIAEHVESPFNKTPLITQMTNEGNKTLTNTSFTQWNNGEVTKEDIDERRYKELVKQHFGL
ncbi:arylamine N-acetyltransferase [Bacillus sp. AFS041924]|uniref:arylamine N-acetyltransferase family protein n=1 Tax=Bacillus sp. AFS041924 TaxID=2033503 RepID=UPI000BFDF66F|nr:arylamine N-acetyltransferase [Bacillus sp. AFS041924]PGS56396.1 arylamine N-acetyltransferase [Bacillus sp. AFS041924]